jgi:DNA-binding NarL/FixJ family response regulator
MKKITILIIDDQQLVREAWSSLLITSPGFKITGSTESITEAIKIAANKHPHVILLEVSLKGKLSSPFVPKLLASSPRSRIIALTAHALPAYRLKMFKKGALGYITKNSSKKELIEGIMKVVKGETYICAEMKEIEKNPQKRPVKRDLFHTLTNRELQVMKLIKAGLSSKKIAFKMNLSWKTIEVHRYNIFKKLNLKKASVLINLMHKKGL